MVTSAMRRLRFSDYLLRLAELHVHYRSAEDSLAIARRAGFVTDLHICRSARDSGLSQGHEMIRLRFLHPGRHVWRVWRRRDHALEERWVSFRRVPPHWEKIFSSTLDLIWLPNTPQARTHSAEAMSVGLLHGTKSRWVTRITIRLQGFFGGQTISGCDHAVKGRALSLT